MDIVLVALWQVRDKRQYISIAKCYDKQLKHLTDQYPAGTNKLYDTVPKLLLLIGTRLIISA